MVLDSMQLVPVPLFEEADYNNRKHLPVKSPFYPESVHQSFAPEHILLRPRYFETVSYSHHNMLLLYDCAHPVPYWVEKVQYTYFP